MDIRCHSPFQSRDPSGELQDVVVIEGTYELQDERTLRIAREQEPVSVKDEYWGAPNETSVRQESDLAPFEPKADVVVSGDAYAPGGEPAESWPVQIWIDDHTHALRVSRPSERRTVEAHLPHTLLDTLAFEAPASFQALEAPGGTETHRALDLFHRDPRGAFNGLVRVDLDIGVLAGRSTIAPSG